ncbi:MAG: hypothetical protein LBT13_07665 [Treponema sp.]|nr:hypothetical protein [Treponema sp.]
MIHETKRDVESLKGDLYKSQLEWTGFMSNIRADIKYIKDVLNELKQGMGRHAAQE